ncbi:YcxB family protein [Bernardetia sp.]|uniref:YcxB family protein n=1 Tax=Bernardetia sp. TaxID=1937974 RepID=UPI0025C18D3B|nr:YcxB family protein [Bernardetia sp.]
MKEKIIEVKAKLSFEEYLRLNFSLLLRSKIVWLSIFLATMLVVMLLEKRITDGEWADSELKLGLLLSLMVFLFLVLPILTYLRTKSYFEEHPALSELTTFYFEPERIEVVTSESHATLTWRRIYKIREFKHYLLIYQNRHIAYVVPKKSFNPESDMEKVKEMIRTKTKLGHKLKE